jgi:hypothetical protein
LIDRASAAEPDLAWHRPALYAATMSFTATVENDTFKLPPGVHLPDGTKVTVEPQRTVADRLAAFIGIADDLPSDLARNHDHYLHGAPKRTK